MITCHSILRNNKNTPLTITLAQKAKHPLNVAQEDHLEIPLAELFLIISYFERSMTLTHYKSIYL